jgi:hypothetical protein
MDVTEIDFETLAGEMSQRDEGFLMSSPVPPQIALHLAVTAGIAVLVAEATEHLHGGVPLLGRGVLIVGQDLVDDRPELPQDRGGSLVGPGVGIGLGLCEDLTNLPPGVMKRARDFADGHAIASGAANCSVIVHRKHILSSVRDRVSRKTSSLNGGGYGGSLLCAHFAPGWVPFTRLFPGLPNPRWGRTHKIADRTWEVGVRDVLLLNSTRPQCQLRPGF